jgi:hypothetical protein
MLRAAVLENASSDEQGVVVLTRRSDGMIDGIVTKKGDDTPQTSAVGFVAIPGGSADYFILVQRVPAAEKANFTSSVAGATDSLRRSGRDVRARRTWRE